MKYTYKISGMHCAACIERIKTALTSTYDIVVITLNPPQLQIQADASPSLEKLNLLLASAGKYRLQSTEVIQKKNQSTLSTYYPIFLIAAYIVGIASLNNLHGGKMDWHHWMNQFMAGFFIVFSAFKMLDLKGFATGYASYDLLAKKWFRYGYLYPFFELSLGILYLGNWLPTATQVSTVILMGFSSIGVMISLIKKQPIKCACLGTLLNVPLSKITLIEDLLMVGMAACALLTN